MSAGLAQVGGGGRPTGPRSAGLAAKVIDGDPPAEVIAEVAVPKKHSGRSFRRTTGRDVLSQCPWDSAVNSPVSDDFSGRT
jgi:hypothetical protein